MQRSHRDFGRRLSKRQKPQQCFAHDTTAQQRQHVKHNARNEQQDRRHHPRVPFGRGEEDSEMAQERDAQRHRQAPLTAQGGRRQGDGLLMHGPHVRGSERAPSHCQAATLAPRIGQYPERSEFHRPSLGEPRARKYASPAQSHSHCTARFPLSRIVLSYSRCHLAPLSLAARRPQASATPRSSSS